MSDDHSHGTATGQHRNRLVAVLAITVTILVVELIGGLVSGSLALLADAGHMFTDAVGVGLALLAASFAARPVTPERTFGYQRSEILAAVANAVLLSGSPPTCWSRPPEDSPPQQRCRPGSCWLSPQWVLSPMPARCCC